MFSTTHKFLFIHVPKTAGNSIQEALGPYSDDERLVLHAFHDGVEDFGVRSRTYATEKHSRYADYEREYGPAMLAELFAFSCIRNPWDRCMSHFFSRHRGNVEWREDAFLKFVETRVHPLAYYWARRPEGESLAAAAANLAFIIRYERLEQDFAAVCGKLGLPALKLAHRNASPRKSPRTFYNAHTIQFVADRFQEEIAHFGYAFE